MYLEPAKRAKFGGIKGVYEPDRFRLLTCARLCPRVEGFQAPLSSLSPVPSSALSSNKALPDIRAQFRGEKSRIHMRSTM